MFRSLTLMLAFAVTAALAPAAYLWVPGHGLTGKSGASETVDQLIRKCKNPETDNGVRMPWMRIIEKEYKWKSLETAKNDYDGDNLNPNPDDGVAQIVQDAVKCKDAGMYLRVMILHKYTDYPAYMATEDMYAQIGTDGNGFPTYNIKLDKKNQAGDKVVLLRLQALYKAVITALRNDANNAKAGFYGFVLQETTIGDDGTYFGDDTNPNLEQYKKNRRAVWFDHLREFHDWLASNSQLGQFDPNPSAPYRGRLFWQMINTPDGGSNGAGTAADEIGAIIAHRRRLNQPANQNPGKGMGLCGPDTFPREPSKTNFDAQGNPLPPSTTILFRSYETMRDWRDEMPISLHVYAGNYRHDRPHQHAAMVPGIVPLWIGGPNTDAINGYDNYDAGDGLFNFLGCAGNIGTANWQIGDRDDNMNLHNVIWSTAEGDLAEFEDYPLDKSTNGTYIEAGETFPGSKKSRKFGHYGWSKVKEAMQANDGKFVDNWVGGLNNVRPFAAQ